MTNRARSCRSASRRAATWSPRAGAFAPLFLMVSSRKIGTWAIQTRATAGVAGATYIFCLPGSPGACRDAWDEILVHQLDYRYRPCNFVEIMPRLGAHLPRAKAKGATVYLIVIARRLKADEAIPVSRSPSLRDCFAS